MGLATRVVDPGQAHAEAEALARQLASMPQPGLRSDRAAVYRGLGDSLQDGLVNEARLGQQVIEQEDLSAAAARFDRDPPDAPSSTDT